MATQIDIINNAIAKLGSKPISSLNEEVKPARVMKAIYEPTLKALLRMHPWNFAMSRALIAPDADSPTWGFSHKYTLPVDFIRFVEIENDPQYKIEEGKVLTNVSGGLNIRYVRYITDTTKFDDLFSDAFSDYLAYRGCESFTQSNTKKKALGEDFKISLQDAQNVDAQEDDVDELDESLWITVR